MEIIGFILSGLILAFITGSWMFMFLFNGSFGKRDIPLKVMFLLLVFIGYLWSLLIEYSPFSVVIN